MNKSGRGISATGLYRTARQGIEMIDQQHLTNALDTYWQTVDRIYIHERDRILLWFNDTYAKEGRTLQWVDGMGCGFWVYNDEILDPDSYGHKRIFKVLAPCLDFVNSFHNIPWGISQIPAIGNKSNKEIS